MMFWKTRFYTTPSVRGLAAVLTLLLSTAIVQAQEVQWEVLSPLPDSIVPAGNLFIAARVNNPHNFKSGQVTIYLDNNPVSGVPRVSGAQVSFLHAGVLPDGRHTIRIEAMLTGTIPEVKEWVFYVNTRTKAKGSGDAPRVRYYGTITMDNRSTFLSGSGKDLRQEPTHIGTVGVDVMAKYKNAELPVKVFMTTNDRFSSQSMNYYQIGFRNRWLEIEAGDLNPNMDRLILTGVRLRGASAKIHTGGHSIHVFTGELNRASEGSLIGYTPGSGMLPTNPVNDSQYISPGIYKRTMTAVRIELGDRRQLFKVGLNGFKAKDVISSIKYGVAPKENIAGGLDLSLNLFKRALAIQSGIAGSVLTHNTLLGVLTKGTLDTTYGVKLGFDPEAYKNIITMNASTVPGSLENLDFLAWYSTVAYTNRYQSLYVEYRQNGSLYNSLGNPFLRANYQGMIVGDRFILLKRKLSIDLNYQNYSNDLNHNLPVKVNTQSYRANVFVNPGGDWPMIFANFLSQSRNGSNVIEGVLPINDVVSNYLLGLNLNRRFWNADHHFRLMFNMNTRDDINRPQNKFTSYNGSLGLSERFGRRYAINADFGKMLLQGADSKPLSDIMTYNLSFEWQAKPEILLASIALANNQTLATEFSTPSHRASAILRMNYRFYKGMSLDLEGGYQPYRNQVNTTENYDESYVYVRYICDLGQLLY